MIPRSLIEAVKLFKANSYALSNEELELAMWLSMETSALHASKNGPNCEVDVTVDQRCSVAWRVFMEGVLILGEILVPSVQDALSEMAFIWANNFSAF